MRADVESWTIPLTRFNDAAWIETRLASAPADARGGLGTALRYLYLDDGPTNLEPARFRVAVAHLEPVEERAARWMKTRTNGSERKRYGKKSILAARRARFRCEDCGHSDVRTLEIDHVDGRLGETDLRCLCANCYRIKSHSDSEKRNHTRPAPPI